MKSCKKRITRGLITKLSIAAISLLSACGPEAIRVGSSNLTLYGPGSYRVPSKVDIVLAQDNTGSIFEVWDQVNSQVPSFLNSLEASGWDYHFSVLPLTSERDITQVAVSRYDGNYAPNWLPPFPGADPYYNKVSSWAFRTPENFSQFLTLSDVSNGLNGYEPGFETLSNVLSDLEVFTPGQPIPPGWDPDDWIQAFPPQTGDDPDDPLFMRSDSMLVMVVMGNGDDTSGRRFVTQPDGKVVPWNGYSAYPTHSTHYPYCHSPQACRNLYKSEFQALKPGKPDLVKMFAAVSANNSSCLGSETKAGLEYMAMAGELGGDTIDICSQPVTNVLGNLQQYLEEERIEFRTRYLVLPNPPNTETLKITKHFPGGGSQVLTQSGTDGWIYEEYLSNVFTIDYPVLQNRASGYMIRLHGNARLRGDEWVTIEYLPAGAQPAQS